MADNHAAAQAVPAGSSQEQDSEVLVAEEVLVEEISIDGMCGVY